VGAAAGAGRAAQGQRACEGRASVPCREDLFWHKKVRYKGLAKNEAQLFSLFGLANLVIAKRRWLALDPRCV
jgi:IS5 family transposase